MKTIVFMLAFIVSLVCAQTPQKQTLPKFEDIRTKKVEEMPIQRAYVTKFTATNLSTGAVHGYDSLHIMLTDTIEMHAYMILFVVANNMGQGGGDLSHEDYSKVKAYYIKRKHLSVSLEGCPEGEVLMFLHLYLGPKSVVDGTEINSDQVWICPFNFTYKPLK